MLRLPDSVAAVAIADFVAAERRSASAVPGVGRARQVGALLGSTRG